MANIDIPNAFIEMDVGCKFATTRLIGKVCRDDIQDSSIDLSQTSQNWYQGKHSLINMDAKVCIWYRKASLLFYINMVKYSKSKGFRLNPYYPCIAENIIEGYQINSLWN